MSIRSFEVFSNEGDLPTETCNNISLQYPSFLHDIWAHTFWCPIRHDYGDYRHGALTVLATFLKQCHTPRVRTSICLDPNGFYSAHRGRMNWSSARTLSP